MLRVEAVQRELVVDGLGRKGSKEALGRKTSKEGLGRSREGWGSGREDTEGLVEDFRRRMGVLKRVVDQTENSVKHLRVADEKEDDQGQPQHDNSASRSAEKGEDKTEDS